MLRARGSCSATPHRARGPRHPPGSACARPGFTRAGSIPFIARLLWHSREGRAAPCDVSMAPPPGVTSEGPAAPPLCSSPLLSLRPAHHRHLGHTTDRRHRTPRGALSPGARRTSPMTSVGSQAGNDTAEETTFSDEWKTYQVMERNCKMQNSTASPFLCH